MPSKNNFGISRVVRAVVSAMSRHRLAATLVVGSVLVVFWTLFRFFISASNFDLVGQQVMIAQWLTGGMDGAVVGPTHHLVKAFLIFVPLDWLNLSPRLLLIGATLVVNVITFVAVVYFAQKIVHELGVKPRGAFYWAAVWLATVAGSVFWIHYINSRNLEVAAGVLLVYLAIRLVRPGSVRFVYWMGFGVLAAAVFFVDPLQLYMTGLPIAVYALVSSWIEKANIARAATITAVLLAGAVAAKGMTALVSAWLGVIFIESAPALQSLAAVLASPIQAAIGLVKSNLMLFSGAHEMGHARMYLNAALFAVLLAIWIWAAVRKKISQKATVFVLTFFVIGELAYFASGQSLNDGTSRYLIMLAPAMLVLIASLPKIKFVPWLIGAVVAVNAVMLTVAFIGESRGAFSKDAHIRDTKEYLDSRDFAYVYGSMDTALPYAYFYPDATPILPLTCHDGKLQKSNLFYSQKSYITNESRSTDEVAVILDGSSINNHPHACNSDGVIVQLGQPQRTEATPGGSAVLIYKSEARNVSDYLE